MFLKTNLTFEFITNRFYKTSLLRGPLFKFVELDFISTNIDFTMLYVYIFWKDQTFAYQFI